MKISWIYITLISVSALVIILLILIIIRKKCSKPTTPTDLATIDAEKRDTSLKEGSNKRRSVVRQRKRFFSWSDHPSLSAEAVENGWQRFALVAGDDGEGSNVEMSWEVFDESVDYMQKIRLAQTTSFCLVRGALPLPGPQFANTSFPKEAYFEIRVLPNHHGEEMEVKNKKLEEVEVEDESLLVAIGLIGGSDSHFPLDNPGSFLGSVGFDSTGSVCLDDEEVAGGGAAVEHGGDGFQLVGGHAAGGGGVEGGVVEKRVEDGVGEAGFGILGRRRPDAGGTKLVGKSENGEWGRTGNVIGCGFDPNQKRVFFTLNSKLVYEIRCKREEFGHPLYPTLTANGDVSVVVNLGQSPFKYGPANSRRTQNPCFMNKNASTDTAPFNELDSQELFSMGKIDGKWKQWCNEEYNKTECDHMSEADLFEIVTK
ncbi:hypothetical protein SASPL_134533 [Salvia splendens]|uniref:SPRY domain-containing protein n=1 Tax=Salvia splendens TaxID=180675 RepID=A0A8X8ZJE1_SALSN|nr:hypothetical protein SASPL_134533 [Salvia splendens]